MSRILSRLYCLIYSFSQFTGRHLRDVLTIALPLLRAIRIVLHETGARFFAFPTLLAFALILDVIFEHRIQNAAKLIHTAKAFFGVSLILDIIEDFNAFLKDIFVLFRHTIFQCEIEFGVQQDLLKHGFERLSLILQHFPKGLAGRNQSVIRSCQFRSSQAFVQFLNFSFDEAIFNSVLDMGCNFFKARRKIRIFEHLGKLCSCSFGCTLRRIRPPVTVFQRAAPTSTRRKISEQDMPDFMDTKSLNCVVLQLTGVEISNDITANTNGHKVSVSASRHVLIGTHSHHQVGSAGIFFLFGYVIAESTKIGANTGNHVLGSIFRVLPVGIRTEECGIIRRRNLSSQLFHTATPVFVIMNAHASTSFRRPLRLYTVFGV